MRKFGKNFPENEMRQRLPNFFLGINFSGWVRLLIRNNFALHWRHLPTAFLITLMSLFNSVFGLLKDLWYGKRIKQIGIKEPPVFILGHWRSGTTFLHELLTLDPRHTCSTYIQSINPNHFLFSKWFITDRLGFLMPRSRPMDNMALAWDRPAEDEFALCNLGLPSSYDSLAFPNRASESFKYMFFSNFSTSEQTKWKEAFLKFLKEITFRTPKGIILKSPQHTCRIKVLLELFPDARFIHMVRNPYDLFPSTINLWKNLYQSQSLQKPNFKGLEELVFETFPKMDQSLEEGKKLIDPARFYQLRYEDLVRDPIGKLKEVYKCLDLGDFEPALPYVKEHLAGIENYQPTQYEMTPEKIGKITQRWGSIIEKYGYPLEKLEARETRSAAL